MSPEYLEIKKLLAEEKLDHRLINFRLLCIHRGWKFKRLSEGGEYSWAYNDVEPSPEYKGKGGHVVKGTLVFYNPNPGTGGHHNQLWAAPPPQYTLDMSWALELAKKFAPGEKITLVIEETPHASVTKGRKTYWSQSSCVSEAHALLSALFSSLTEDEK